MKKLFLFLIFVLFSNSALAVTEGFEGKEPSKVGEEIKEPTTPEEAKELENRYEEEKESAKQAEERLVENQKKLDDPTVTPQERSKLQEQIGKDTSVADSYKQMDKELGKPAVKELIKRFTEEIARDYQLSEVALRNMPREVKKAFQYEDAFRVQDLAENFSRDFDSDALNKKVAEAKTVDQKLYAIEEGRVKVRLVREPLEKELEAIKKGEKTVSPEYQKSLDEFKERIDTKIEVLDAQSLALDAPGFFERVTKGFKNWFDSIFDFHKDVAEKRSIDAELASIARNKKTIAPLAKFFDAAEAVENNANGLVKAIDGMVEVGRMNVDEFSKILERATRISKSLEAIDKKFTPENEKQINEAYDSLQKLTGDLLAKSKRYKGEYATLFDSEMAAYTNEFDPTRIGFTPQEKAFGPNEAYETLGLTKEVLGFDPQENPDDVTPKQIEDAYEKVRKTYGENTYEWKAARNASTILRNPTGKLIYDAFVKDWTALKQKGFDPAESQKSSSAQEWLNTNGVLVKLEISKELHDKIFNQGLVVLGEVMSDIGSLRTQDEDIGSPLRQQLSRARTSLQDALSRAQKAAQASKPISSSTSSSGVPQL